MSTFGDSGLATLEQEGRLYNHVFKGATRVAGRYGFRGELALKFAPKLADEARPPELLAEQVMIVAEAGKPTIPFLACYLLSFEYLKQLFEVLGDTVSESGHYFLFCNNIPLDQRFRVPFGGAVAHILPIDDATAYNELLELLYLEKNDLKKLDTGAKLDAIYAAALKFKDSSKEVSYEQGLQIMGPVRNPNENRPV